MIPSDMAKFLPLDMAEAIKKEINKNIQILSKTDMKDRNELFRGNNSAVPSINSFQL